MKESHWGNPWVTKPCTDTSPPASQEETERTLNPVTIFNNDLLLTSSLMLSIACVIIGQPVVYRLATEEAVGAQLATRRTRVSSSLSPAMGQTQTKATPPRSNYAPRPSRADKSSPPSPRGGKKPSRRGGPKKERAAEDR